MNYILNREHISNMNEIWKEPWDRVELGRSSWKVFSGCFHCAYSVMYDFLRPHELFSVHGDSPDKNTEVGCMPPSRDWIFPTQQ